MQYDNLCFLIGGFNTTKGYVVSPRENYIHDSSVQMYKDWAFLTAPEFLKGLDSPYCDWVKIQLSLCYFSLLTFITPSQVYLLLPWMYFQ